MARAAAALAGMTIREKRTYRADGWDTFEEYCQERWGWSRQRASQLIQASSVVVGLSSTFDILPDTARTAAELHRLPEPERAEVWQQAQQEHGENVTSAKVREMELEENLQRKDLTAYERSKTLVSLAETAADADKESFVRSSHETPGRPEAPGSLRRVR